MDGEFLVCSLEIATLLVFCFRLCVDVRMFFVFVFISANLDINDGYTIHSTHACNRILLLEHANGLHGFTENRRSLLGRVLQCNPLGFFQLHRHSRKIFITGTNPEILQTPHSQRIRLLNAADSRGETK